MVYVKFYNKKIKRKASLKECVEFHFNDVDLCTENGKKLVYQYYLDRGVRCHQDNVYGALLGENKKWRDAGDFVYIIMSWETDDIWPEEAMDLCQTFHDEYLYDFPTLISIHEDKHAVHAHMLVRKVDSYEEQVDLQFHDLFQPENKYYGHDMVLVENVKLPYEFRTYFDMMHYLMY